MTENLRAARRLLGVVDQGGEALVSQQTRQVILSGEKLTPSEPRVARALSPRPSLASNC